MRYSTALPLVLDTEEGGLAARARCRRTLHAACGFVLGRQRLRQRCAVRYRPMLRRSAVTAFVVGTLLVAINQGGTVAAGHVGASLRWQIPLTYTVPFLVASWGALNNSKAASNAGT